MGYIVFQWIFGNRVIYPSDIFYIDPSDDFYIVSDVLVIPPDSSVAFLVVKIVTLVFKYGFS